MSDNEASAVFKMLGYVILFSLVMGFGVGLGTKWLLGV